jgi:hypothetical protein
MAEKDLFRLNLSPGTEAVPLVHFHSSSFLFPFRSALMEAKRSNLPFRCIDTLPEAAAEVAEQIMSRLRFHHPA